MKTSPVELINKSIGDRSVNTLQYPVKIPLITGGKNKTTMYNNKKYVVYTGTRGGQYILINKNKKYLK